MSTDIGYLQTKIREQQEKIDALNNQIELVNTKFSKFEENINSILIVCFEKAEEKKRENIRILFEEEFSKYFKEQWHKVYTDLHVQVDKEIFIFRDNMKIFINNFIDEVILARKDLGVVSSILLSKKIVTEDEIKLIDQKMQTAMNKAEWRQQIHNSFFPIIHKMKRKEMKKYEN